MVRRGVARTAHNLCLHYVGEGGALWQSPAELTARLVALEAQGLRPASLADYVGGAPGADRYTVSFDDAHRSVMDALAPLAARGVTATVFAPTAYVGSSDDFLTWDELRSLRDAGWTIASHTVTHPRLAWRLYDEDEAAHRRRIDDELARSRDVIARELGDAPALFAYPFGEASPMAREAAARAGYDAAFTVAGDSAWAGDRFAIPRVEPPAPDVPEEPTRFSVIVPAFDRARILSDVVTRLASQTYPPDRYEVLVVDDGSREDLTPIFAEMPDRVRLLPSAGDATFRAGQARQRGADAARFEHLAFLDADVAVDPDFLWHLDWVHRRSADTVLLGYLSGYNLHDLGHLHRPDDVIGAPLDGLSVICDRSREPTLRACLDNLDWLDEPWGLTYTGNLSLPAALLRRVGGFAREFEGWGLEDLDLGVRLHRAGARFAFSRFALGVHVVDPSEPESRNPFRRDAPRREDFAGYLANLDRFEARHPDDPAVRAHAERARRDIEETCGRPMTVGVEVGGQASVRSVHHRALHRVQPGGRPLEELLDRVAYAAKVRAQTLYLLGGAVAERPDLIRLLEAASAAVGWVSMETLAYPFARPGLVDEAARAGLRGVVALVETLDPETYEALHGPGTFAAFDAGLRALEAAPFERAAHLVVSARTMPSVASIVSLLDARGWRLEEVSVLDPTLEPAIRAIVTDVPLRVRGDTADSEAY